MGLSNITFILILILLFIPIYYLVPFAVRKYLILICSIIFYAVIDILTLPVLVANVLITYFLCSRMSRTEAAVSRRAICTGGIILQLAIMVSSVILPKTDIPLFSYHSFVGIGFMTVNLISYYLDVYWTPEKASADIIDFFCYAFFFPKILQGPVTSYKEMATLRFPANYSPEHLEKGLRIFILGLSMKVLLADRLYYLWNGVQTIGLNSISASLAWLTMYSYSLQLYLDFQGYSLMAIGISQMLGITLPVNFRTPYLSRSISEFYRRWHISLGNWFKEYIYIPFGGSRKGKFRTILNLSLVWIATGLWHGLTLNFMMWAMALLIFIILEKTILASFVKSKNKIAAALSHLYVLIVIPFTWMLFANRDFSSIQIFFTRLFDFSGQSGLNINPDDFEKYITTYWPYLICGVICCFPFVEDFFTKTRTIVSRAASFVLFWVCIYFIMKNGNNPFMYANF